MAEEIILNKNKSMGINWTFFSETEAKDLPHSLIKKEIEFGCYKYPIYHMAITHEL